MVVDTHQHSAEYVSAKPQSRSIGRKTDVPPFFIPPRTAVNKSVMLVTVFPLQARNLRDASRNLSLLMASPLIQSLSDLL